MDKRHLERIKTVQNLFAASFPDLKNNLPYNNDNLSKEILKNIKKIDDLIALNAPKYPLNRIAKADLAILRLAVHELIINPTQPYKVVINEAIELAKEFGGERSYAFVNAVLGTIFKNCKQDDKKND
ncbi:MAG: transcription antitermination factor NusB [Candidatus Roizmanbacteria bacterium]|nr:MAG: transcription antitermination factor NusB [Candidatus Roizmanbacteria bacterium]